jgi:hypothetical protein
LVRAQEGEQKLKSNTRNSVGFFILMPYSFGFYEIGLGALKVDLCVELE